MAFDPVDLGQHLPEHSDPSFNCLANSPFLLHVQDQGQARTGFPGDLDLVQPLAFGQERGLACFASQSNQQVGTDVGVSGESRQCPHQLLVVGAAILHGTAMLVNNRDHPINVRVFLQKLGGELLADQT